MKKMKKISELKKDLWKVFSLYIKLKESEDGLCECISCGKTLEIGTSDCQAGHFLPKGAYPGLYFIEDNVWPQCYRCNIALRGNFFEYEMNLIEIIGKKRVQRLKESRHKVVKYTVSDYLELIEHYKKKIDELS